VRRPRGRVNRPRSRLLEDPPRRGARFTIVAVHRDQNLARSARAGPARMAFRARLGMPEPQRPTNKSARRAANRGAAERRQERSRRNQRTRSWDGECAETGEKPKSTANAQACHATAAAAGALMSFTAADASGSSRSGNSTDISESRKPRACSSSMIAFARRRRPDDAMHGGFMASRCARAARPRHSRSTGKRVGQVLLFSPKYQKNLAIPRADPAPTQAAPRHKPCCS
jgi:hypothetical protein